MRFPFQLAVLFLAGCAANLKGNAYVLTALVVDRGISLPFAQGDAYKCP